MPDNGSILVVPLRSNAYTLLTGAPIAAMRRRLKFASLFYDRLILETGIFRVHAGPTGSSSFIVPPTEQDPPRWQTPAERHAATGEPFTVMLTAEGRPDAAPRPVVSSVASISWTATLHPFADELPPGTDWIDFRKSIDPVGGIKEIVQQWARADERNRALHDAVPDRFAREVVINSANRDLVLAAAAGCAVTIDPLHMQVVAQRFNDEDGWGLRGYSVPVVFPKVGDLSWEAVADVRRDRNMASFRAVLQEVEAEAFAEAAGGDIEAAVHHAYEKHLERATPVEGIRVPVEHTAGGLLISAATGAAAMPLAGLGGLIASTLGGGVAGGVLDARSYFRHRRSRGWVAVASRLRGNSPQRNASNAAFA